jgi:hypothetical protein
MDSKEPQSSPTQTEATNSGSSTKEPLYPKGQIYYWGKYLAAKLLKPGETWLSRAQRPMTPEEKEARAVTDAEFKRLGIKSHPQSGSTGISGS